MTNPNERSEDEKSVDVSSEETHYTIQCEDISLVSTLLRPLNEDDDSFESSQFSLKISISMQDNQAWGYLSTKIISVDPGAPGEKSGYLLLFDLAARFSAEEQISPQEITDFAKLYTLSILWPYAREYASDQFRRTGKHCQTLPVINPQVVTERLIEEDLIEVTVLGSP